MRTGILQHGQHGANALLVQADALLDFRFFLLV